MKGGWICLIRHFLWDILLKVQRIIMLFTICFATTAMCLEVFMRYILKSPFIGIEELAAYFAFWLYFIGSSYGSYERSHITADLSQMVFKNPLNRAKARLFASLISCIVILIILPWSFDYVKWGWVMKEQSRSTFLGNTFPVVYFQASLFFGFALMLFYSVVESYQWFKAAFIDRDVPHKMFLPREETHSWIG
jgi:TRAP-type C4-dicarboxylate transport system permease small subunit